MRSFGSSGLVRTCSWSWARAAAGSPLFRLNSAASAGIDASSAALAPRVFEGRGALRHAVAALRRVLDGNLVERECDPLQQRRTAAVVAGFDVESHHAAVRDGDLEVLDLRRAGLAQREDPFLDHLVGPEGA